MPRERKIATEIATEIARIVNSNREVREDGETVEIHEPYALDKPDAEGVNWSPPGYSGSPNYVGIVHAAIQQVRARFNLPDDR